MTFERMLRYCRLLEANNNRTWFHENHAEYEAAKADFTALVDLLRFAVADKTAPPLAEALLLAEARNMQYRIPKDMRVHKYELPYNPSFRAYLAADRHALRPVGFFLRIAPGGQSVFGTGAWCPDSAWLRRMRQYISEHYERFSLALAQCGYPLTGERLKRPPAGFSADDPALEVLKYKEWFVSETYSDAELTEFDSFARSVAAAVERMEPLRQFFDDAFAQKPLWDETA